MLGFQRQKVSIPPYRLRTFLNLFFTYMTGNIVLVIVYFKRTKTFITGILDNRRILTATFPALQSNYMTHSNFTVAYYHITLYNIYHVFK